MAESDRLIRKPSYPVWLSGRGGTGQSPIQEATGGGVPKLAWPAGPDAKKGREDRSIADPGGTGGSAPKFRTPEVEEFGTRRGGTATFYQPRRGGSQDKPPLRLGNHPGAVKKDQKVRMRIEN